VGLKLKPESPLSAANESWRVRLRAAHFHDYSSASFRMWLAIVLAGGLSLAWSLHSLAASTAPHLLQTVLGVLLVAAAAWFPVEIPRSKFSISAADAFVFTVLAVLGTPAAILASGADGLVGALRTTRRLTSRVSTPAASMAAMALCGTLFEALSTSLTAWGWTLATARLAALVLVSLVPFVLTTLPLMATVTLKRGKWPHLRDWFSGLSWVAAMYVAAALVAGIVQLSAIQQGPAAVGIIAAAALVVVILLRTSIAKNEAEHNAQEARISEAEMEAERNQQRFVAAFTEAAIGMAIVEPGGGILRANKALCALLQRTEVQLAGQPFLAVLHPSDVELFERQAREVASRKDSTAYSIELRCLAGAGGELWVALHCGRFSDPGSAVDGLIYQLQDITSRQMAESRLQHIAFHDSLTDLANRAYFHEKLAVAVEASRLDPAVHFAVMFLDLDRFKVVNDSLGHFAGNELLREVGKRLLQCLRPNDLVARLGGDEFAVLLRDPCSSEDGLRLAERMLAELAVPVSIFGNEIVPSASVGITFSDMSYRTVDELLRDADLAMYEAKAAGRARVVIFNRTMHDRIADKLSLEADLRRAIGEGELSLSFQPLFNLEPYRLVGFEALARWMHPARGPIGPTVFIGVAEEAGHIEALTTWVLDKAVEQLAAWHRAAPHMAHTGMSVNISGRDLAQPEFLDRVLSVLQRHGVAPTLLTLEITESVLMSHLALARDTLARLRSFGVQLAIDDFGTGYSSLTYLSTLPIDCLKIDRSFVTSIAHGAENVEIVRAVLTLGQALAKSVVAEGIETPEQLHTLRRLGVHVGQGYLLAHPMRADQVSAFLYAPATLPA
jgi:diguanylate cyclase (GGDEF)-like protein/PAS domain S-box-containing protein